MDREHLYGALQSSLDTITKQNEFLSKYNNSKDGILVWLSWVQQYSNHGSTSLRIGQIERFFHKPFDSTDPAKVPVYIDEFISKSNELKQLYRKAEDEGEEPEDW